MEIFMKEITQFAVNNAIIGVVMFTLSYVAITAFNYAGKRQVSLTHSNGKQILKQP
jgi:hypothetical protein